MDLSPIKIAVDCVGITMKHHQRFMAELRAYMRPPGDAHVATPIPVSMAPDDREQTSVRALDLAEHPMAGGVTQQALHTISDR